MPRAQYDKNYIGSEWINDITKEPYTIINTGCDRLPFPPDPDVTILRRSDSHRFIIAYSTLEEFYTYIPPMKGAYC